MPFVLNRKGKVVVQCKKDMNASKPSIIIIIIILVAPSPSGGIFSKQLFGEEHWLLLLLILIEQKLRVGFNICYRITPFQHLRGG